MEKLICLHPDDNVLVIRRTIQPGDKEVINGTEIMFPVSLGLGHKIAAKEIVRGERIIKYGVPIGSATRDIATGEHLHLHNIKSDYLATYTLDHEYIHSK